MPSPALSDITMDFFEALRAIRDGQRVTRLEWGDASFYCLLLQGRLTLHKDDGKFYGWIINDGDMLAEDWITLDTAVTAA